MNSQERVRLALDHREPDRVPFDLGGTLLTSIHVQAYGRLRRFLGLPEVQPTIADLYEQVVRVDEDVVQLLGIDVVHVGPKNPSSPAITFQEDEGYRYFYDQFGIGWRMPREAGLYYDMFHHPLSGATSAHDVDSLSWPDPLDSARFRGLPDAVRLASADGQRAVVLGNLSGGVQEVTAWLRGFEDYYADLVQNPRLIGRILDRVLEVKVGYWSRALELVGDQVDVVQEADDFAGQFSMLISPETYRTLVKPRHRELFDSIHKRSSAKIFFHSCGAMRPVIPDLIEIGVDILNPVQVSAAGMDTAELKREFGRDLVFWGGGVDTQETLCHGTASQVRDEARRRLQDLMPGGGFVFATVHNVQADVSPQNFMALWETVQEYGSYAG